MEKEIFLKDLEKIYNMIEKRQEDINLFYKLLDEKEQGKEYLHLKKVFVECFLDILDIENSKENILAVINRIVNLRSDSLKQVLQKKAFSEEEIEEKMEKAYILVSRYYISRHKTIIDEIEEEKLLSPFYRELIKGVHEIGISFTKWQTKWTNHIIYGVNKELFKYFNGDEEKIFEMLIEKKLLDKGHNEEIADRTYSALVKNSAGEFESRAYCDIFEKEVEEVVLKIEKLINTLLVLEDNTFNEKEYIIEYFTNIKNALLEKEPNLLVQKWADVDRAWMKIKSPIQVGHPLEYYEDHYRKAVALEWDLRIVNPNINTSNIIDNIKSMYNKYFNELKNVSHETMKIYETSQKSLNSVQLYLGSPALFYGAEFEGLFSAQVVPNDEIVSKELGKKIFAFADNVYRTQKAKPFLKLHREIFPSDFLDESRKFLFQKEKEWYEVYNITTIGHEYGHILWIDDDTESKMNQSGQFKNLEEFKATVGGLVAFFENQDENLLEYVIQDTIKRAVGLISWMETPEVLPYYCEGLLHLHGLFESKVLAFDKKLTLDKTKYLDLIEWYKTTYKEVATLYLQKKDAKKFLINYIIKEKNSFMPKDEKTKYFVNYYWNLYKDIGQVIDDTISKDDYLK